MKKAARTVSGTTLFSEILFVVKFCSEYFSPLVSNILTNQLKIIINITYLRIPTFSNYIFWISLHLPRAKPA